MKTCKVKEMMKGNNVKGLKWVIQWLWCPTYLVSTNSNFASIVKNKISGINSLLFKHVCASKTCIWCELILILHQTFKFHLLIMIHYLHNHSYSFQTLFFFLFLYPSLSISIFVIIKQRVPNVFLLKKNLY